MCDYQFRSTWELLADVGGDGACSTVWGKTEECLAPSSVGLRWVNQYLSFFFLVPTLAPDKENVWFGTFCFVLFFFAGGMK